GQFVAATDIAGGLLVYNAAPNGNGSPYASFTFQVQDSGGTAGGALDLDQSPNTMTLNVTAVNDAPVLGGTNAGSVTEDGTASASGTLTVADADPGESSYQASSGSLTYGSFALQTDGSWSYTLNNAAVQSLGAGQSVSDQFTATSLDGTASQQVTITIH